MKPSLPPQKRIELWEYLPLVYAQSMVVIAVSEIEEVMPGFVCSELMDRNSHVLTFLVNV